MSKRLVAVPKSIIFEQAAEASLDIAADLMSALYDKAYEDLQAKKRLEAFLSNKEKRHDVDKVNQDDIR